MNLFGRDKELRSIPDMPESDRVRFFVEDILAPIISAGGIDDVESKVLNCAWFLYRMDESYQHDRFKRIIDAALQEGTDAACTKTPEEIRSAFLRACTVADKATYNEFNTIVAWFDDRARRAGGALFSCRDTSRWAEEHLRHAVDEIQRKKGASAASAAESDATAVASDAKEGPPPLIHKADSTVESGPSAPSTLGSGTLPQAEAETATRRGIVAPNEGVCPPPKERAARTDTPSTSVPASAKEDATEALDPPKIIDVDMPPDYWHRLTGRVDTLLEDLPRYAGQILDEFGGVERAQEKMLLHKSRGDKLWKVFAVSASDASHLGPLWIIGDVHGDLLALEAALAYVETQNTEPRIVLLGDLFDRGPHSYQVVLRVLQAVARRPGRICLLSGNHDVGMSVNTSDRPCTFSSRINPSDFTEELNARRHTDVLINKAGQTICGVSHGAPRAIFFEDGLFLAHAGIPQADTWDGLTTIDALNTDQCLADFTFRRTKQSARGRGVRRDTEYSEFGFRDFCGFCRAAEKALGFLPRLMVRGHDHVDANSRVEVFEKWGNRVVTVSNICYSQSGSDTDNQKWLGLDYVRRPAIVKAECGKKGIEVHVLNIPASAVTRYYPEPVELLTPPTTDPKQQ